MTKWTRPQDYNVSPEARLWKVLPPDPPRPPVVIVREETETTQTGIERVNGKLVRIVRVTKPSGEVGDTITPLE